MTGCFGNHPVDRWMENNLNEHLDSFDNSCEACGKDIDDHNDDQADECNKQAQINEVPKVGLHFLVWSKKELWHWVDREGLSNKMLEVSACYLNGEIINE